MVSDNLKTLLDFYTPHQLTILCSILFTAIHGGVFILSFFTHPDKWSLILSILTYILGII